jgi:hypothetical protein
VKSNSYELNFILSPRVEAELENNSVIIFDKKNRERKLLSVYTELIAEQSGAGGAWKIEDWSVSPRYGAQTKSAKLIFTAQVKGDFQIRSIFDDGRQPSDFRGNSPEN